MFFLNFPNEIKQLIKISSDIINIKKDLVDMDFDLTDNIKNFLKQNNFFNQNNITIEFFNEKDVELNLKIFNIFLENNKNIKEEKDINIMKSFMNYWVLNDNIININNSDFLNIFLQSLHFSFLTINDSLLEKLKINNLSETFLKNYKGLFNVEDYKYNITNLLNNQILKNENKNELENIYNVLFDINKTFSNISNRTKKQIKV